MLLKLLMAVKGTQNWRVGMCCHACMCVCMYTCLHVIEIVNGCDGDAELACSYVLPRMYVCMYVYAHAYMLSKLLMAAMGRW
jgi:hypothetical protein